MSFNECQVITKKLQDVEIVHLYDIVTKDYIYSRGNSFFGAISNKAFNFKIPFKENKKILNIFTSFRFFRRLLRLDKSNVGYCPIENLLYVIYRGEIFTYCLKSKLLKLVHKLRQSRNTLHMGLLIHEGFVYIGEYGDSSELGVPIWKGKKDHWTKAYEFAPNKIKHIHGIYYDQFENSIWVTTGDFAGQCYLLKTSDHFSSIEYIGNGNQKFRSVNLLFSASKIFWAMDSPLEQNYCHYFVRGENELRTVEDDFLKGPVWYMKSLTDGYLLQTSVEKGPGVMSNESEIYFSKDLINWKMITKFKKDTLPLPLFKNGVIAFADGIQSSDDFVFFGEALKGVDGKAFTCSIETKL